MGDSFHRGGCRLPPRLRERRALPGWTGKRPFPNPGLAHLFARRMNRRRHLRIRCYRCEFCCASDVPEPAGHVGPSASSLGMANWQRVRCCRAARLVWWDQGA